MRRKRSANFYWTIFVLYAWVVLIVGSFAQNQIRGLSVRDSVIGAIAGTALITLVFVVAWLCQRYDDR